MKTITLAGEKLVEVREALRARIEFLEAVMAGCGTKNPALENVPMSLEHDLTLLRRRLLLTKIALHEVTQ